MFGRSARRQRQHKFVQRYPQARDNVAITESRLGRTLSGVTFPRKEKVALGELRESIEEGLECMGISLSLRDVVPLA